MTHQTDSYRQMIYNAPYEICIERAKYYTESYKETEGQHPAIRAARALEKTLDNMTIYILDHEQIVGNRSSKLVGAFIPVERGDLNIVIKSDLKRLKKRKFQPYKIEKSDEKILLKEILPYWKGKTIREMKVKYWKEYGLFWRGDWDLESWNKRFEQFGSEWIEQFYNRLVRTPGAPSLKEILEKQNKDYTQLEETLKPTLAGLENIISRGFDALMANNPNFVNNVFDVQGHLILGHKNILKWGYEGIKKLATERLNEINKELSNSIGINNRNLSVTSEINQFIQEYSDPAKFFQDRFSKNGYTIDNKAFLEAVIISCNSSMKFIKRFAKLAREKAIEEKNQKRAAELERISESCSWISTNMPRNFREAIQLVWFNHVIATISHGLAGVLAVGRADQYLYPYYKSDIEKGAITPNEVTGLLEDLLIKLSYNLLMIPTYGKDTASELGADNAAITVGGVDKDGNDAVNELSYLFMDAIQNIKSMTNSFSIRIAPEKNPKKWVERTIEIFSKTSGPAVYNDDIIIPAIQKTGVSLDDARDYGIIGCVEPSSQGNTFSCTSGNDISLVGLLEMVLTNGMIKMMGKPFGVKTGDPKKFKSYEEVWNAYKLQLKHMINHIAKCVNTKNLLYANFYPNPFISMTLDGCIENALDMTQGGAKYDFDSISGRGLATAANSLCALKKLVFEDKEITMEEFIKILNKNYEGNELFQIKLKNKLPKFGNDDDYVDEIAKDIVNIFCDEVMSHPCIRNSGIFRPGFFSYGMYIVDGYFLGATPDGRSAGEPVSNSLSPSNNTERKGPTAVFKSLAKIDTTKISNGLALNMRLLPMLIQKPEDREKFADLLLTYLKIGGQQVQFNVVNQEDLIDAQIHPENHRDLVVRVSGYNAYFIDLGKPVQDDIIDRYQFDNI
ncbi:MAG: pyruvate formate lyase family protein [Promethearchaeota archaeon]